MRRAISALSACIITVAFLAAARAEEPDNDGMNCESFSWIDQGSCHAWKAFNNGEGHRWWATFSRDTGRVQTEYVSRKPDQARGPALDAITRSAARSRVDLHQLLRNVARRLLRPHASELGLRPGLADLLFTDFSIEPATDVEHWVLTTANSASVVKTTVTTPAIFHIDLAQVIDDLPVQGGGVMVSLSEQTNAHGAAQGDSGSKSADEFDLGPATVNGNGWNIGEGVTYTLVSIDSHYQTAKPAGPSRPRMTSADAIAAALNALGISSASTSGPTTAFVEWALRGSELRLAWDVEGALDDANANEPFKVVLFDSDQSVVSSESPVSTAPCSDPYLPYQFAGYQGGVGRGYIDHPRLEYPNPATDGFSLTTLIGDLQDLPLNEVCSFSGVNSEKLNGLPWGHYVRVVDVQNAAPQAPLSGGTFQFRPSSDLTAMLLFDQNLNGDATPGDDSSIGVNDPPIPMQNVASDPDIKLGAPADHDNPDGQPD